MTTLYRILDALKESGCFVGDIDDARAELKAKDEEIKKLSKKCAEIAYDFECAVEKIEKFKEDMKPKTCLDCKHYSQSKFYGDVKVVKYCHENRLGIDDINFQIFCCNRFEPKDNA